MKKLLNGAKGSIFCAEDFKVISIDPSFSGFTFQSVQYGRGWGDPSCEKPDKYPFRGLGPASTVFHYGDSIYTWCDVIHMALILGGLPPNNPLPQSYHEKNIPQIPVGHTTKYLTVLLIIVKIIKTRESLRHCHSQEEPKETWWLNIMWCLGWDPGTENGH